jgi:antimicrobial peptide system SdpB family protein
LLILPVALTDDRRWHWQSSALPEDGKANARTLRKIVALTALVAIRVQVSIVYFHAAIGKLSVEEWINGTALYYWLTNPTFGLPDWLRVMGPILTSRWIVVITWSVLFLETGLFMALVMPKGARKYWLIAGILFHAGIAITMGLFSFSLAMFAALILYLRPPEQQFAFSAVTNLFQRIRAASRGRSPVPNLANY